MLSQKQCATLTALIDTSPLKQTYASLWWYEAMEELTSTEYNTILKTLQQEASVLTEHVLENVEGDPKTGKLLLKNLWTLRKTLSKQEEAADTEPVSPEELLSSLDA